ncbi:MAG: thioredoxin domain-containing protein [Sphingomonadales bacterium]|nr:thioredoxin domain-containing protein [Sphingomonadales bacterium]MDE2568360.1 thioredoxin domain-containing protein [Sphingomonadales bacterium]
MTKIRAHLLLAAALPLALGLAACGKKDDAAAGGAPDVHSTPLAKVAAPAGKQWSDVVSKTAEGGYRMGNPDAPVKLIEFGALSCSHCAEFADKGSARLRDDYVASGRVSYEFRPFMLNVFDIAATLLATCGSPDAVIPLSDQFWAWQPNLYTNLDSKKDQVQAAGNLPPEQRFAALAELGGMTDFFAARGISKDQAKACLANTAAATQLAKETQDAGDKYGITGTPTFYLNGKNIGSLTWEGLEPILQDAGAR